MATLDEEIDPSAKYLERTGTVTIEPAPKDLNVKPTFKKSSVDLENLNPELKERIKLAEEAWLVNKEFNPISICFFGINRIGSIRSN